MLRDALTVLGLSLGLVSALPVLAQAPTDIVQTPIVMGQSYALPSAVYGGTREINVWLPPGYADSGKTYPVLYLLDGGQDQDFHHISGLVQLGTVVGTTKDLILIGVASKDRRNELAFRATHDASLVADYPTHGQSERFRRFIAEEVKPFVEAHYRTDGDDGVIGESLAGLFIVETFLKQPALFDRYMAISPSVWWDDGALVSEAPALIAAQAPAPRTLGLTIADEGGEMQAAMDTLVDAIRDPLPEGLIARYEQREGETHATTYHPAALDILRDVYAPPASAAP